jgi:putative inorganic carbon (HCO3(-)) transporter
MSLTSLLIYAAYISLFVGSFYRPIFGVLGYLAVCMTYNTNIWWGSVFNVYLPRPSVIAMIFIIVGALLHIGKLKWGISRREIEFYLFLGAVWMCSLVFGIGIGPENWTYLEKMTKIFIFIFFLIRVVNSLNNYKLVLLTFVLAGLFLAYQAHTVSPSYFRSSRLDFLGGTDFREANAFAAFLTVAITILGFHMLQSPYWKKIIYVLGVGFMFNAIIMTQSRSSFLGLLLGGLYVFIRPPKGFRKLIYVFLALGVVLFFVLADVKFLDRMGTIHEGIETGQDEGMRRLDYWKASLIIFKDYPLGVGIKNFEKIVPHYDPTNTGLDAHNTYVLCYSEIGIFGILLFLLIIGEGWFQLARIRRKGLSGLNKEEIGIHVIILETIYVVYFLGYMTTHSNLYSELLWVLLALPICLENATKKLLDAKSFPANKRTSKQYFLLWKRPTIQSTGKMAH